jgi:predicted permease
VTTSRPALLGGAVLDLKATLRSLARRPAFAAAAVLTIALGIGATTAMFSAVDAILLRALPYAQPDRLVAILPGKGVANQDVDALRNRARAFDQVAGFSPGWLMALTEIDVPRQLNAARVTGNMFSMIGAAPMLGRVFGPESEAPGAGAVAVLGHELWRTSFGGDSAIIGRSIMLDGARVTVVAVMPRDFRLFDWQSDLWTPLTMGRDEFTWAGATGLAYGRLAPGTTLTAANAELPGVVAGMISEFSYAADWGRDARAISLQESLVGDASRMLWLMFGAVVVLLLIATGNVANLLLVRSSERRGELALRRSLGAPTARIARLLLGESLVLGAAGGLLGVAIAMAAITFLPGLLPPDVPRLAEISLNGRVLAFAALATLVPSFGFGLAPLLHTWRAGLATTLRESRGGAIGGERARGLLVSLQVALCLILLVGASIMGRSLVSLLTVDRGLRSDHLLTATIQPVGVRGAAEVRAFWRQVLERVEGLPGVASAATILHLPTSGRSWNADIDVEGRPLPAGRSKPRAAWQTVSTGYFRTAGVPVIAGRTFEATDIAGAPLVVVVNAAFAAAMFPGESALGRRIVAGNATGNQPATIVGVVPGVRHDSLSAPPAPEIYLPIEQRMVYAMSLIVRTNADPLSLATAVRDRVWSVNRNVPVTRMRSMDDVFSASVERPRLILYVLALFAAMGLLMGAIGIYGVVAYGVQQRLRELGIRAALGADSSMLHRMVVRGGLRYALLGVLIGIPAGLALSGLLRGLVFGVGPADPVSFSLAPLLLVLMAGIASWVPARKAARSDPMLALREE